MELLQEKKRLAQAIRTLAAGGILAMTVGHASVRQRDGSILMLGHAHKDGRTLDEVTHDEIVLLDADGGLIDGKYEGPGERFIHTEVYRARPDVGAVVHGHPAASEIVGISGREFLAVDHRAGQFADGVPVMDYAGQIDSPRLGGQAAGILGGHTAMLLRGHGQIVVGAGLEEACLNAFLLEDNAVKLIGACLLGTPRGLRPDEIRRQKPTSVWRYYVRKFDPMFGEEGYLF